MRFFRRFRRDFRLEDGARSGGGEGADPDRRAIDEEIEFHLRKATEEKVSRGIDPAAARRAAEAEFGDLEATREYCARLDRRRERRRGVTMRIEQLVQDLRHAVRSLRKSPGFSAVVLLTLGFGIAVNTIVFSVLNPYFLRPLPFGDPDDLVQVHQIDAIDGWDQDRFSLAQAEDWVARSRSLAESGLYVYGSAVLSGGERPEQLYVTRVGADLFGEVLRVEPMLGRSFLPEEEGPGGADVVILDHGLWQGRFGGDPDVVGRTVSLDGVPHTVVGVMPPLFTFPWNEVKLWRPIRATATTEPRDRSGYIMVARLAPGWTIEEAEAELSAIQRELAEAYPDSDADYRGANVLPLRQALNFAWRPLLLGFGVLVVAMGFVLLLACVNLAGLTLARVAARSREMAIRAALGAGRARLIRQLLSESVLLAVGGGLLGLGASWLAMEALNPLLPEAIFMVGGATLDGRVLLFAAALTMATPILFALWPAVRAGRPDLLPALKEGSSGQGFGPSALRSRRLLVAAQVALAMVLVTGAGLMVRSLDRVYDLDLGFRAEGLLTGHVILPSNRLQEPEERNAYFDEAVRRAGALPEIRAAATVYPLPLNHETMSTRFLVPERAPGDPGAWPLAAWFRVSPGYFGTMGVELLSGRDFSGADGPDGAPVVVVNRTLAERFWGGESPVGRTILVGAPDDATEMTVVGVAEDVYHGGLNEPPGPQIYLPSARRPLRVQYVVAAARAEGPRAAAAGAGPDAAVGPRGVGASDRRAAVLAEPLREALASVDPEIPVDVRPMYEVVRENTFLWTIPSLVLAAFGVAALLLAALGLYGTVAYAVRRRRREMGIRMALGAGAAEVRRAVLGDGLRLTALGAAAGLVLSLVAGRVMSAVLFGVSPFDPVTLGGALVVFLAVAVLASLLPAVRASRTDPVEVLRAE